MTETASHPFSNIKPTVCADRLAYIMFTRKDVPQMAQFLEDFGFTKACEKGNSHYFRGFGDLPYSVEIIASDKDSLVGIGFVAKQSNDLEILAAKTGNTIKPNQNPGGGRVLQLTDPNGYRVDFLTDLELLETVDQREALTALNTPWETTRIDQPVRAPSGPAPVKGLGHFVLQTPDFDTTVTWYMENFGLLASDLLHAGGQTKPYGLAFLRLNRGQALADHHTVAILAGPEPALLHVSTETIDIDAIGHGQQHLLEAGWEHYWGMGRHVLGSQFFDYWKDPTGDEWEHYADGDMLTEDYVTGIHHLDRKGLWAWGHDLPASMRPPGPAPDEAPQPVKDLVDALLLPPRPWLD